MAPAYVQKAINDLKILKLGCRVKLKGPEASADWRRAHDKLQTIIRELSKGRGK